MSELSEKEFDVILLHYLNMLWDEKAKIMSNGDGDALFVPNVLDRDHLRVLQSNGVVAAHGTECFMMHFFNAQTNCLCLLNVGQSKNLHILDRALYVRCAGQLENGIAKEFRDEEDGFTAVKSVSPLDKHTHRGFACDLQPVWFDYLSRAEGYKCEGHRDCSPIFVIYYY